jgi:hypothetical protein
MKENITGTKQKWKTCRMLPRKEKAANQKSSEAESLNI